MLQHLPPICLLEVQPAFVAAAEGLAHGYVFKHRPVPCNDGLAARVPTIYPLFGMPLCTLPVMQDLELADAAAAEGQADADKRWQQCFVTALNAAAMKGISDTNAAGTDSQQGNKHRWVAAALTSSSWLTTSF